MLRLLLPGDREVAGLLALLLALPHTTAVAAPKPGRGGGGAVTTPTCRLPESNAEGLVILSNFYPGYWWDHTHLTIAVQAHPRAKPATSSACSPAARSR